MVGSRFEPKVGSRFLAARRQRRLTRLFIAALDDGLFFPCERRRKFNGGLFTVGRHYSAIRNANQADHDPDYRLWGNLVIGTKTSTFLLATEVNRGSELNERGSDVRGSSAAVRERTPALLPP